MITLFAAVSNLDEELLKKSLEAGPKTPVREALIVVGVLIILALVLFLWAKFVRKSHRRHVSGMLYKKESRTGSGFGPRRRRRRHRGHRPRNPTLAETGGLPPPRPEDQPPTGL